PPLCCGSGPGSSRNPWFAGCFFFSSRRRHTRFSRDWSPDVCSSDLMGLVVNHPNGLELADIMEQLRPDQPPAPASHDLPVYSGGPVQTDRGFVLHDSGWQYQATLDLGELALSTSLDVLFAIADGHGPRRSLITLGYAGWDAGQLEAEIADNTWLHCPCDARLLFDLPAEQRLLAAAATLGIDLHLLGSQAGHA